MKIIEANIVQFGKFKNKVFTFDDGFNIVKGDNESGKSTLLGFIKFALYGVGRKNPNVVVGERERALAWNAGIAAGSLTIEDVDKKKYRIERSGREAARGSYIDKARIIDLETGEEVFSDEVPGEHFLGINAQAYDSMCNIKQLETVSVGADAVKGVIDNLLSSGDESMDIQAALKTLDIERRRLMHTNNKGGLVYESAMTLERLKGDYKTSVLYENERMKNTDELERVEVILTKAREEHGHAQRMCDLYDDVLRIEKFNQIHSLESDEKAINSEIAELDEGAKFDIHDASYEKIAQLRSACDSFAKSESAFENAQSNYIAAEKSASRLGEVDSHGFEEIIEEFRSPVGAISHLASKKKKKSSSALALTVFSVAGAVALAFAAALAFVMSNTSGALTVGFIGALLCVIAVVFFVRFKSAKSEISLFISRLGGDFCPKQEDEILSALNSFCETRDLRAKTIAELESAKMRLDMARDDVTNDKNALLQLALSLGLSENEGKKEVLLALCDEMKRYLEDRASLNAKLQEKITHRALLSKELERFNENNLRARITPEIIEKLKEVPFERLKSERDAALQRTNQWSQYKAGIERNLAAYSSRKNANELFAEIEAEQENFSALKLRLDAVRLAMETINTASMNLKSDITPKISERAQTNLSLVTSGKYNELFIGKDMSLSVFAEGATRPIDSLSRGSLDAAYFSVRLALLQTLLGDKYPPLYMDECLSQLDDTRAKNVLAAIEKHSRDSQCILFTCQNRDVALAKQVASVNLIEL